VLHALHGETMTSQEAAVRIAGVLIASVLVFVSSVPAARDEAAAQSSALAALVERAGGIRVPNRTTEGYAAAAAAWRTLLEDLKTIDRAALGLDDQVDYDLLDAHARTEVFEIDTVRRHELNPGSYVSFGATSRLFLRDGVLPEPDVRAAIREMEGAPTVFDAARRLLTVPARTWTENALYQTYYARLMLGEEVLGLNIGNPALRREFLDAAAAAGSAVEEYAAWLETVLLPRSTRSPAWNPDDIDFYQIVHEQLDEFDVDAMIRVAEAEAAELRHEMEDLARRIHPSGDLRTTWEVMKSEAPPWPGVIPMAQRYVDMASDWLRGAGSHVVTIPDYLVYGARLSPPMARRTLSFGGATAGPAIDGRQSGYYILTPLEDRLTSEEKASRIKSYNPYWTHVISYHEWLGHTVQIASSRANVTRPMRRLFSSIYFGQAWSFYLEKLFEDEGYYDTLPYMERLKTLMARRQMRMWRVQRILTKCRMARGEMTFDEAVQAYIDEIGMEPTNAFIEVQRDSQSPSPPGREIIGEIMILRLRDEYRAEFGAEYSLKRFNDELISYGSLSFRQIRRLMIEARRDR